MPQVRSIASVKHNLFDTNVDGRKGGRSGGQKVGLSAV
jgi:hypothetical protein